MSCADTFSDYAFRAIGIGERLLPRSEISLCDQFILIGSGLIWNLYFTSIALGFGFFFSAALAFARISNTVWISQPTAFFIFVVRGSPIFLQFFICYELFVLLPKMSIPVNFGFGEWAVQTRWLARAWLGAVLVLFLNTSAYTAYIFHKAILAVPKTQIEAAKALGLTQKQINRHIIWPVALRIAWGSYTNEVIFLLHASTLVFVSSFPAWRQQGDALYYASYFAEKTFNPFIAYPIIATYFVMITLLITYGSRHISKRLHRHL